MKRLAHELAPGQIAIMKCRCVVECLQFERAEIGGSRNMLYRVTQSCDSIVGCRCATSEQRSGLTFLRLWEMPLEFDPLASALNQSFADS